MYCHSKDKHEHEHEHQAGSHVHNGKRPWCIAMSTPTTTSITSTNITAATNGKPRVCQQSSHEGNIWSEDRVSVRGFPFFLPSLS